MRPLAGILVAVAAGPTACAAISGLDSYSPGEGVDAGSAGHGGESASDGGVPGEDGAGAVDASAQDDGSAGSGDAGCGAGVACTGGATCVDGVCTGGPDGGVDAGSGSAGDAGCTRVSLPPSVNVDATQWSFDASPTWNCTSGATTTITANASGASIGGDTCGDSAVLADITNAYAQSTGGPSALVIRLKSLTVTGGHVLQLTGT